MATTALRISKKNTSIRTYKLWFAQMDMIPDTQRTKNCKLRSIVFAHALILLAIHYLFLRVAYILNAMGKLVWKMDIRL